MAGKSKQAPTNEHIVRLLEEVKAQLADAAKRQERIEHDLTHALEQR